MNANERAAIYLEAAQIIDRGRIEKYCCASLAKCHPASTYRIKEDFPEFDLWWRYGEVNHGGSWWTFMDGTWEDRNNQRVLTLLFAREMALNS